MSTDDSSPPTPITKTIAWPSCQEFDPELGVTKINEFMDNCWEKGVDWRHCTDFLREEKNEHDRSYKYQVKTYSHTQKGDSKSAATSCGGTHQALFSECISSGLVGNVVQL